MNANADIYKENRAVVSDSSIPGEPGLWIILFGDLAIFSLFFIYYLIYYGESPAAYSHDQEALSQIIGLINTLLLIASSFFVALAVKLWKLGNRKALHFTIITMICGLGFVVLKCFEWYEKFSSGISIASSEFFMFYFMLSGIHLVHLIVGLVLLLVFAIKQYHRSAISEALAEGSVMFWHLVDLLWVMLFPLLYLVRI